MTDDFGATRGISRSIKKIQPAYRQIADQMSGLIVEGSLTPGQQLPPEDGLAASFGVSRNTVREALRILASRGLVVTTRGATGGTFVAQPDPELVQSIFETNLGLLSGSGRVRRDEIYEVRTELEVAAAIMAARRCTEEQLEQLRTTATATEDGLDVVTRTETSDAFHDAILAAAQNSLLGLVTRPLWRVFRHPIDGAGLPEGAWAQADAEHRVIIDAIERHDADAAGRAMRAHLEHLTSTSV